MKISDVKVGSTYSHPTQKSITYFRVLVWDHELGAVLQCHDSELTAVNMNILSAISLLEESKLITEEEYKVGVDRLWLEPEFLKSHQNIKRRSDWEVFQKEVLERRKIVVDDEKKVNVVENYQKIQVLENEKDILVTLNDKKQKVEKGSKSGEVLTFSVVRAKFLLLSEIVSDDVLKDVRDDLKALDYMLEGSAKDQNKKIKEFLKEESCLIKLSPHKENGFLKISVISDSLYEKGIWK